MSRRTAGFPLATVVVGLALAASGCALRFAPPPGQAPMRLSDAAQEGDATRRASQRLLLQGLDADSAGREDAARSFYERAIQVDATNPYAYLALARHEVDAGRWNRALEALDQAELLFGADGAAGVEAHLAGLRGAAKRGKGYGAAGQPLLAKAGELAPDVWSDGHLSAEELR